METHLAPQESLRTHQDTPMTRRAEKRPSDKADVTGLAVPNGSCPSPPAHLLALLVPGSLRLPPAPTPAHYLFFPTLRGASRAWPLLLACPLASRALWGPAGLAGGGLQRLDWRLEVKRLGIYSSGLPVLPSSQPSSPGHPGRSFIP